MIRQKVETCEGGGSGVALPLSLSLPLPFLAGESFCWAEGDGLRATGGEYDSGSYN